MPTKEYWLSYCDGYEGRELGESGYRVQYAYDEGVADREAVRKIRGTRLAT